MYQSRNGMSSRCNFQSCRNLRRAIKIRIMDKASKEVILLEAKSAGRCGRFLHRYMVSAVEIVAE